MKAPRPCEFRRSVELAAPVEAVYAFHENPHNVGKISPSWQAVRVLQGAATAQTGQEFEIEVRLLRLVPLRWRGIWREATAPGLLVDEALASPFSSWRHHHHFERIDAGRTRMIDHISYQFPGGWLGKVFGETFGRLQFVLMFLDRHRRTARWFRERPSA